MKDTFKILITQKGYPDNWSGESEWLYKAFEDMGHIMVPFIINFRHTHSYAPYASANRILRYRLNKMVAKYCPDIVFIIHGGGYWTKEMLNDLKNAGVFTIYYPNDDPMLFNAVSRHIAPYCNVVITFPKVVELYKRELGVNAYEYICSADPAVTKESKPNIGIKRKIDILFTGGIDNMRKKRRGDYIYALHKANVGKVYYFGHNLIQGELDFLKDIYHGEIRDNVEQNNLMRSSKIVFHYTQELLPEERNPALPDIYQSISERLLNGAAAGCLVMTNYFVDLEKVFEIGKEVVVYDGIKDAIEKARYYLNNEKERKRIALAGRRKVLSKYTINNCVHNILEIIKRCLSR